MDIKVGDEICISYIDNLAEFEDRQFQLRTYGFECDCHKCVSDRKQ